MRYKRYERKETIGLRIENGYDNCRNKEVDPKEYTAVAVQHEERGVLQKIPYFIHFKSEDFWGKWKRM